MEASEGTGERGRERCGRSVKEKEAGVLCFSLEGGRKGSVLRSVALFMDFRFTSLRSCTAVSVEEAACLDAVLGLGAAVLLHL